MSLYKGKEQGSPKGVNERTFRTGVEGKTLAKDFFRRKGREGRPSKRTKVPDAPEAQDPSERFSRILGEGSIEKGEALEMLKMETGPRWGRRPRRTIAQVEERSGVRSTTKTNGISTEEK